MYCDVRSYTCIFFGVRQAMYNTFTRWQDCAAPARRVNQRVAMLGAPETPKVTRWPQPRDRGGRKVVEMGSSSSNNAKMACRGRRSHGAGNRRETSPDPVTAGPDGAGQNAEEFYFTYTTAAAATRTLRELDDMLYVSTLISIGGNE